MATVNMTNVSKSFADTVVVDSLNLTIHDGEFVVFVGPSGCGKTTSLRLLAGLEEVSSGHIHLDDKDLNKVPAKDRDMAMVFQNYALYPHMTVAENIGFSLSLRRLSRAVIGEKIRDAAELVGIGELLDRRPRELSGGQRQRVAVCRAIVRNPRVFLFDEPLSNLDPQLRSSARAEIRTLQRRLGTTSVYVTHDQVEAMTMADRIVIMRGGKVQQIGTPEDLYEAPANAFVASFLGSPPMNIFDAPVANGWVHVLGLPVCPATPGSTYKAGLRPECLSLRDDGPARMQVALVEMVGAESLVHGHVDDEALVIRVPRPAAPKAGETMGLAWSEAALYLFDAASGHRLAHPEAKAA